ncbi:MAG: hypothetical protein F2534_15085 [Actinobacteria bacterium]|nr:hypothetical protein [Actinomycetota bacterium]
MPLTMTLDTSCVIAIVERQEVHPLQALDELVELAEAGHIRLQLAEAYERDFERFRRDEKARVDRLRFLASAPIEPRRAGGPARFDVSRFDGVDVWASETDARLADELQRILPGKGSNLSKRHSDADHLLAHRRSRADLFVTVDRTTILVYANELAELGIVVIDPVEAVIYARRGLE